MSAAAERVDSLASIKLISIRPNGANPRRSVGDVSELAASIREQGLIQPLVVAPRPDGLFQLIAGHRRFAALKALRHERALCVVRTAKGDVETVAMMLAENGQRVNLTPLEEARAMQRLLDKGLSQADIARRIGKSQTVVSQRLSLLALRPDEQEQLERREMTVQDAVHTARIRKGTHEQTKYTGWHLGKTHPLADQAQSRCRRSNHPADRRLARIACGACWEAVIRADERRAS